MRRKEQAKVEPRSCQENKNRKATTKNKRKRKESKRKPETKNKKPPRKTGQASGKPLFDTVMGGSDAESRVDRKLSGVPPWETQRECTNELIGSGLVEHEKQGKHP